MSSLRRGPLHGRRAAAAVFGLFVAAGLVLVFSGTLARSTDIAAEATRLQAEIAVLEARVAAGADEIAFFETDDSVPWQARVQGYGGPGETLFSLQENAPSPEPIPPLGGRTEQRQASSPFDAWLELLFGA